MSGATSLLLAATCASSDLLCLLPHPPAFHVPSLHPPWDHIMVADPLSINLRVARYVKSSDPNRPALPSVPLHHHPSTPPLKRSHSNRWPPQPHTPVPTSMTLLRPALPQWMGRNASTAAATMAAAAALCPDPRAAGGKIHARLPRLWRAGTDGGAGGESAEVEAPWVRAPSRLRVCADADIHAVPNPPHHTQPPPMPPPPQSMKPPRAALGCIPQRPPPPAAVEISSLRDELVLFWAAHAPPDDGAVRVASGAEFDDDGDVAEGADHGSAFEEIPLCIAYMSPTLQHIHECS
ncbi:hypothetical protein BDK51DRAFT_36514, partial [Blyttiomyces helicus]